MKSELELLAEKARARFNAMSPEEQAEHRQAQRESWVRAFTTPCEHGRLDFEQCGECRDEIVRTLIQSGGNDGWPIMR